MAIEIPIQKIDIRQICKVAGVVCQVVGNVHTAKASSRSEKPLPHQSLPGMDGIRRRLVREFHGVFEDLHKATGGVILVDRTNVHDERITCNLMPLTGEPDSIWSNFRQGDHVQMRVPQAGAFAALDFVRPDSPLDHIEHRPPTPLLALPQLPLSRVQVFEALPKVCAIFDGQSDQEGP